MLQKPNFIDAQICKMEKEYWDLVHFNKVAMPLSALEVRRHLDDQDYNPPLTDDIRHYLWRKVRAETLLDIMCRMVDVVAD